MSSESDQSSSMVCCFCGCSEDNESEFGKFYKHDGITTHYYCLLLSSNMEQKGNDDEGILGFLTADIKKEIRRGKRLICVHCKKSGATLGCCNIKCKQVFHYPCGKRAGSLNQFFGEFRSFCRKHRPKQKIDDHVRKELEKTNNILCYICYDEVNPQDFVQTLWAPCCKKNAWFHRKCVQQLANSAGYFFKCPLCNNKKEFQKAMQEFGIFIPSQDASWELVPHAFQELMYRHDQCDAPVCLCPKGRKHTSSNAKWELALCRTCGSQGIHMACGQLKWAKPNWECGECTSILSKNVQSTSAVKLDLPPESPDSDDSDSDISVGVELPVVYSSSMPDNCSVLSCSSDSAESVAMIDTLSGPKSIEVGMECVNEGNTSMSHVSNSSISTSTENLHRSNHESCSSRNFRSSLTFNNNEDDIIAIGSVDNTGILRTPRSLRKDAFFIETVEQDEIQFIGMSKVDNLCQSNNKSVERSSTTRNVISEKDGTSDSVETPLNIKITNLISLTSEDFGNITETRDTKTISELCPNYSSETNKTICSKDISLSSVFKENIATKVKRKPDLTYFVDKSGKKMKADDFNEVIIETITPLKETSNQMLSTEVQDTGTVSLSKGNKSDNGCVLYESPRRKISNGAPNTLNAYASRRKYVRSPLSNYVPSNATIDGTEFCLISSSPETQMRDNANYEINKFTRNSVDSESLTNGVREQSQSDEAMNSGKNESIEELSCNEILKRSESVHKNKDYNHDASCAGQRSVSALECTEMQKEKVQRNSRCKQGTCCTESHSRRYSSTQRTSFGTSTQTREFTFEEVIYELTKTQRACNCPRLIPNYVDLRDLKFRLVGTNSVQMILFNEYSVKMETDTEREKNVNLVDVFIQKMDRKEFSKQHCGTSHSDVFVNNDSSVSSSSKKDKDECGELTNNYARPHNDDAKENLDPVGISCRIIQNSNTSENGVASKVLSREVNASVNLHISNCITDNESFIAHGRQDSQQNSLRCISSTAKILQNDIDSKRCSTDKCTTTEDVYTDINFIFLKKSTQRTAQNRMFDNVNMNLKNNLSIRNTYSLKESSASLTNVSSSLPNLKDRKKCLVTEQNVSSVENVECVSSSTVGTQHTENIYDRNKSETCKQVSKNIIESSNCKLRNKVQTCLKVSIDLNKIQNLIDANPDILKKQNRTYNKYSEQNNSVGKFNESNKANSQNEHVESTATVRHAKNTKCFSSENGITQLVSCVSDSQKNILDVMKLSEQQFR